MNSMRGRLTLSIVVLTAILASLGVLFGMRFVENDVVSDAIDGRFEEYELFGGSLIMTDAVLGSVESTDLDQLPDNVEATLFADDVFQAEDIAATITSIRTIDTSGFDLAGLIGAEKNDIVLLESFTGRRFPVSLTGEIVTELSPDDSYDIIPTTALNELAVNLLQFLPDQPNPRVRNDATFAYQTRINANDEAVGFIVETGDILDAVASLRRVLWGATVGLVVLAGLATWFLTGRALRPVAAITKQVGEISSGNLDQRVPDPRGKHDEIGTLATTMNGMLDRIERGDQQRRQFVSDASHELRTPVAVLRSEAEVALRAPQATTVPDLAEAVLDESNRMGVIVEDLLTLARVDEQSAQKALMEVDVDELVLAEAARKRRLPIEQSDVSAGRVLAQTDELSRVIVHLLDNAVRHGQSRVAVGVAPSRDSKWIELWVDDDGAGVPMEDRERIFERFVRLDEARTRDTGGSGLGLAVVATTIARFDGTTEVIDSPLGGARFLVRLPALGS